MEISSHILRKSIVGPVSHSLITKLELLVVPKVEYSLSLTTTTKKKWKGKKRKKKKWCSQMY